MKTKCQMNCLEAKNANQLIDLWCNSVGIIERQTTIYWRQSDNLYSSKLATYDYEDSYNPFDHRVVDKPNT